MPITKIPIVHKFGIISHSQRLELQERLLKQSYLQSIQSQKALVKSSKNPLEVSEEFIRNYNSSLSLEDREKYEVTAHKMLERAKRRAGLKNCGVGPYVNLPMAWTELAQLAQCKGKIQEECLDVLITSLDQSPLEKYHIPALFFLAETMLYWLRTDAVHQPYLRTGEIKLLKMGQLTFTRLFYHHMAGQLQGQIDFKNRLFTYLDGKIFSLSLKLCYDTQNLCCVQYSNKSTRESSSNRHEPRENSQSAHSAGAISSSVHDLSPTLWHALDVWRCTNHLGGGLAEALRALATCGMGLSNENWVDTMVALQILAEAAKTNIAAMKILHSLARGVRPKVRGGSPTSTSQSDVSDVYSVSTDEEETQKGRESRISIPSSSKPTLSDIYERSEEDKDSEKKLSRHSRRGDIEMTPTEPEIKQFPLRRSKPVALSVENLEKFDSKLASKDSPNTGLKGPGPREVSFGEIKGERSNLTMGSDRPRITQESKRTGSFMTEPVPGTGWKAEVGSDLPEGRASEASSVPTYTNLPLQDAPGLNGWHWEVAITYTDILSDICLHGSTAGIQKMALMGVNKELTDPFQRGFVSIPLVSAGLLDLAFFHAASEARDGGPNDWSWRIRFGSIQSLVKICRCLSSDKNREGMRTAAWNILIRAHSMEKDDRVLEALKVGQVHTDLENLLAKKDTITPATIGSKIASGLSTIYLPPLPPAVEPYIPPSAKASPRTPLHKREQAPKADKKNRTSLKEEIMLATALYEEPPDFKTRTGFDLRRIVEDQWRKELQIELEAEEKERQRKLEIQQKEEEERQREIAELKAGKFRKKPKEEDIKQAESKEEENVDKKCTADDQKQEAGVENEEERGGGQNMTEE
ncbi:transmembrane protein 232-like [Saccostrea cucullata]|uniref:transmembrane protein 232-like n=1 Tax=Saccostrea cuccullata TaxID=36930 RepID=UPI002ED5680F